MGVKLEGLNIYQQLRELIIFYGLDIDRQVTSYSFGEISTYTISSEDGIIITSGNLTTEISEENVKDMVEKITEYYEVRDLESAKDMKIWLDKNASRRHNKIVD